MPGWGSLSVSEALGMGLSRMASFKLLHTGRNVLLIFSRRYNYLGYAGKCLADPETASDKKRNLMPNRPRIAGSSDMRLSAFLRTNTALILAEWETFARTIIPGADRLELRDHAQ